MKIGQKRSGEQTEPSTGQDLRPYDFIVIDRKLMGVWDLINLGHKGGVLNLHGNYALSVTKKDPKWCHLQLLCYGFDKPRLEQRFTPVKKVKDDESLAKLRDEIKALKIQLTESQSQNNRLLKELSQYKTDNTSTVAEKVHEI